MLKTVPDCCIKGCFVRRNFRHLRALNLSGGSFTVRGLRGLTTLTALRSLRLYYCHNVTDTGLVAVVVPISRHSSARVDVAGCRILRRLTRSLSSVGQV